MKRFLQNSYSWLAMMVLTIMFAVSGSAQAAKAIEFSAAAMQTNSAYHDGVTVTAAYWTGSQFNVYGDLDSEWGYLKVNSALGNIVKVEFNGPSRMNTITCTNGALTSATSTFSTWEGNTDEVIFHSSDDVYVNSITVYVEEGGTATEEVALEFLPTASNLTLDGVTVSAAYWNGSQFNVYGDLDSEWGYLKVSSASGNITKVEFYGASDMNTITCTNGALTSATNAKSIWEGDTEEVIFHSSSDVYVDKVVVYINKSAAPAKECTVGVDHYADNCKPGKHELPFTKYITLYMEAKPASTSWTGSDNCPEGVTFTNEKGESIRVAQFNYWANSDTQVGVVLENEVTTPGVYTLHIPEGIILFEGKKWNKEINVEWTVVAPDTREQKDVTFDFSAGFVAEAEGIAATTDGDFNSFAQGLQVKAGKALKFTAPEKASIVKIVLNHTTTGMGGGLQVMTADSGEYATSAYNQVLTWTGDAQSVTFTSGYNTYIANATVTLAIEEGGEEPAVDPDQEAYPAWKELLKYGGVIDNVAYEYGYKVPTADEPGKKPAAVVAPLIEAYNNYFGLANNADYATAVSILASYYNTTIHENYEYLLGIIAAYEAAELVPEVVEPTYTEPVLKAEDVSAEVAYYIYTDARGGLMYDADKAQLRGTIEKDNNNPVLPQYEVDPTNVLQQFAFVNWEGSLYLYSVAAEKFVGKANRGNFTEEPVDPIYFKNAYNGTVMLYFDDSYNFNLGGSNQVTIDTWKTKDAGNSFKIMVAEKFDQTALLEKLANGGGEVVDPTEPELIASGVVNAYLCDYDLAITYDETHVAFEQYDNDTYVLKNFLGGDDITFSLSNEAGGYWDMAFTSEKGYTDENDYFYLGQTIGTDKVTTEKFWADPWYSYVFRGDYEGRYYHEAYILYWNNEENLWGTILIDFLDEYVAPAEPTEWNGNIILPETAASLDELLRYTVEFEYADEVKAAAGDVLGAIFDGENPYAIVLANGEFNVFGDVDFNGGKATVQFVKISDLNAELQASAKAAAARIGGFTPTAGTATVAFSKNSFKVDGQLVDFFCKSYDIAGGNVTGINGINVNGTDSIYDLSGRRVNNIGSGLYIRNGVKVFMK